MTAEPLLELAARLADDLHAVVLHPMRDSDGLQLDFMAKVDGIRSFESLRSRAASTRFGRHDLKVASLADIITSKKAADAPQDRAVLPILRRTLREKG